MHQVRCAASHASTSSAAASSSSSPRLPAATDISSTANPYIKHCVKLRESSRYRQQQRRLLLVGQTLLSELAEEAGPSLDILVLFLRPGTDLPPGITAERVITVSDSVMKKLTGLEEAAGVQVVAELALPQYVDLQSWSRTSAHSSTSSSSNAAAAGSHQAAAGPQQQQQQQQLQRLLVLEAVQDPGNLGTLLRCAAAFGWDAVWLLPGCCDPFNDKALRASRGAALRWPLAAGSLQELLELVQQRGMLLLAAHPEDPLQQQPGSSPGDVKGVDALSGSNTASAGKQQQQQQPVCLVLGTEGAGLSDEVLAVATPLAVPMSGRMESLNVGVAGAILMFALSEGLQQLLGRLQQLGQVRGPDHDTQ
uniref:tRNA/rRNA methyltransferase SpoU type domain-containing protein n=1 Tax=Tetradesmus obliquus TaxID=3088 RepID=A0A383WFA6_TETOB|eukprot:jgi/Sobl393_1/7088/SZX75704.1